ncbi:MAG: hypothetical protein K6F33_02270 [Bacteroidales bacterium]|nr:hypothetical protein [Bacteroidales bacterium]
MASISIEKETQNYWALLKDAGDQVKLALISLLSDSIRIAPSQPQKTAKTLTAAEIREQKTKEVLTKLRQPKSDQSVDVSWVRDIVKDIPAMESDIDYDKIKDEYLMEKYG